MTWVHILTIFRRKIFVSKEKKRLTMRKVSEDGEAETTN